MKKFILVCVVVISYLATTSNSFAQCVGCAVNNTCHPVGGGLCPDSLPAGTQGVAYDQDITCYLPTQIDAGPFSGGVLGIVDLLSMHIDAISGLPFGLNWTCDHPGNNFAPSSGDTLGCVKICGIPISSAGIYNVTVSVTAGIDAGALGTQYGQTSFNFQMVLFANSSGNIAFNYSPSGVCDSGDFLYTPIITANLPQMVSYDWDFGDGITYSGATPPPHFYNVVGDYAVTCTTTINNLTLTALNFNAANNWWCGDVEETNWPFVGCTAAPDLFFIFTHGSGSYTSSSGSDNTSGSWTGLNVPLTSTSVAISFWDEDAVSADDLGGTYAGVVNAPGVYGFSVGSSISGSFTIGLTMDTVITVTDTIHVYASPGVPTVTASSGDFCPGDSVLLTATPGYTYEWYSNDTVLIATTVSNQLYVSTPGNYSVTVYDLTTGCSNHSASTTIVQNPSILFTFAIQWSAANQWLQSSLSGTISYQWQIWNGSSWVNVGAPEGVQSHYTPTGNGQFQLIAMNTYGCSDTAQYNLTTFGIEDENYASNVLLYPNPTTNSFTLDMKDIKAETITVSIISMMGQVVYQKEFEVSGGAFMQNFDVYEFAKGVYTIDVKVDNYNVRKKLIKD